MIRKHLNAAQVRQLEAARRALLKIDAEAVPIIDAQERHGNIESHPVTGESLSLSFADGLSAALVALGHMLPPDDAVG